MSIYETLLKKVFFSQSKSGLILVPEASSRRDSLQKIKGEFDFKIDFSQFDWEVRELPAGDDFLAAVRGIIRKKNPDKVFLFPPWITRQGIEPRLQKMYQGNSLEMMTLLSTLEVVANATQIGIVMPFSSLNSSSEIDTRRILTETTSINYIVECDADILARNVAPIQITTLIASKHASTQQNITYIQLSSEAEDDQTNLIRGIARLESGNVVEVPYGYKYSEGLDEEYLLSYERYHPNLIRKQIPMLNHFDGGSRLLSELVDHMPTIQEARHTENIISGDQEESASMPILGGRDIREDGSILIGHTRYRIKDVEERYLLREGDICVRRVTGLQKKKAKMYVGIISETMLPAVANNTIAVLRPKQGVSKKQIRIISIYLKSQNAIESLRSFGVSVTISNRILDRLEIPAPGESIIEALDELELAEIAYQNWVEEVINTRSNLFNIPEKRAERLHSKAVTRRVRQRYQVAASMDDFATRVRTRFPHPIAYRWKIIETSYPDYEGYKHILECAEVTIAYLASIAILLAQENGETLSEVVSEAKKLGKNKSHGKTLGYWKRVLEQAKRKFANAPVNLPFFEVIRFLDEGTKEYEALDFLYKARNNDAHGEGPKGNQVENAYSEAFEKLTTLLMSAEFLSEYNLRYIEKTRRDTQNNVTYYDYRELMGDHHLVPIVEGACIEDCEIEASSLYLIDRDDVPHLLRPILIWHPAAESNRSATFYLNRYDDEQDHCEIRSLELGDTILLENMSDQFKSAGLLEVKETK